jgi:glycine oxidase
MDGVVVVGGGLLGCAVAHALSPSRKVVLLERAVLGAEASSAAAGILAPRVEAHGHEPMRTFGIASLDAWEGWLRGLGVAPSVVGFARCGVLVRAAEDAPPDVDARWIPDASSLEPALGGGGAWSLPEEGVVDPRRVMPVLRAAVRDAGVSVRTGDPVVEVRPDAVRLASGETVRGEVVVCAGAWTARVPGVPSVPVRPVRGQLVALEGVGLGRVVFGPGGYVVPRPAEPGRVIAGATVEEAGFVREVTAAGLGAVLATAQRLAPALSGARVVAHWAGLRPGTPDAMPVLGRVDGTWIASGHYRNGVLLAPWTAGAVAAAVRDGAPLPAAWSPSRFGA